jgi:hypothetical protein
MRTFISLETIDGDHNSVNQVIALSLSATFDKRTFNGTSP